MLSSSLLVGEDVPTEMVDDTSLGMFVLHIYILFQNSHCIFVSPFAKNFIPQTKLDLVLSHALDSD